MKIYLLIISIAMAITVNAQTSRSRQVVKIKRASSMYSTDPVSSNVSSTNDVAPQANPRPRTVTSRTSAACQIQSAPKIGTAGNAYGSLHEGTQVWYDDNIKTISFIHRSKCALPTIKGIGYIMYDYSTTNGTTWNTNKGPVFIDPTSTTCANGTVRARYPQGAIYNPPGNITPTSAFITTLGPITDSVNWQSLYQGTTQIGSTTNQQQIYPCTSNNHQFIPDGFHIVKNTGVIWASSEEVESCPIPAPGYVSKDSIGLMKGVFNTSTNQVDYTMSEVGLGLTHNATWSGGLMLYMNKIVWGDDGNTGYIVVTGNDGVKGADTATYLIIYKTTNGGADWTHLRPLDLDPLNSYLNNPVGTSLIALTDLDAVVDKDNNLHVVLTLFPDAGDGQIGVADSSWGVFDVYTTGAGHWYGKLLGMPVNYQGTFGSSPDDISQNSRVQASRSWDGSKVFFSWFDTDSTSGSPPASNTKPDWFAVGYDVVAQKWTANGKQAVNLTMGTGADALCNYANVGYYTIPNGGDEQIPMVYMVFSNVNLPQNPVTFYYGQGACFHADDYTDGGAGVPLFPVGINEYTKPTFSVSSNYPNPFTGSTTVDVTLVKPGDVTLEVSNVVGQVLSTTTYKNLSGKNSLIIDGSRLASGMYFYKIKSGGYEVTRPMTVNTVK